jgi:RNA polymerase sigma-70 factor (ECF subfamily)
MLEDELIFIKKAKDGEVEAFGLLYEHYMPKIYRFVLLKVSHREEAEDLTHQTFLKAWESIEQYDFQGYPFSSWLYRIARNTVIDHYRKSRPQSSLEETNIDLIADNPPLGEGLDKKKNLESILKVIQKLKDTEKEVVIMRFIEDLTIREVAKIIGKSEGATKVIQHRAIKNLRDLLE